MILKGISIVILQHSSYSTEVSSHPPEPYASELLMLLPAPTPHPCHDADILSFQAASPSRCSAAKVS